MAAIDSKIVAREFAMHMKRGGNFASKNPGVILVFCICFMYVRPKSFLFPTEASHQCLHPGPVREMGD